MNTLAQVVAEGAAVALWVLIRPLMGAICSAARCPHHPPIKAETECRKQFSRRRLDHETAYTGLHGNSGA